MNQSWHYSNHYDVWGVRSDLIEMLERHGDDKYCIFWKILVQKLPFIIRRKKFTAEIPSCREAMLLDDLSKSCYLKVKRRRKITEPLRSEFMEEMFLLTVYK